MLGKHFVFVVLLAMTASTQAMPVLPMHFFMPHHEVDEFGAPVHHSILEQDKAGDLLDVHELESLHANPFHEHADVHGHEHQPSTWETKAAVHDSSIHPDHLYYNHTYGIEPEVEVEELRPGFHISPHEHAEEHHESLFPKTHASHGFDRTLDMMDALHHEHLHGHYGHHAHPDHHKFEEHEHHHPHAENDHRLHVHETEGDHSYPHLHDGEDWHHQLPVHHHSPYGQEYGREMHHDPSYLYYDDGHHPHARLHEEDHHFEAHHHPDRYHAEHEYHHVDPHDAHLYGGHSVHDDVHYGNAHGTSYKEEHLYDHEHHHAPFSHDDQAYDHHWPEEYYHQHDLSGEEEAHHHWHDEAPHGHAEHSGHWHDDENAHRHPYEHYGLIHPHEGHYIPQEHVQGENMPHRAHPKEASHADHDHGDQATESSTHPQHASIFNHRINVTSVDAHPMLANGTNQTAHAATDVPLKPTAEDAHHVHLMHSATSGAKK